MIYNTAYKGDVCSHSHSLFLDNFFRRLVQNPKKVVGPYVHDGDTVIDIGCGPGYFTIDMARMAGENGRVIAVDLQQEMLKKVEQKARRHNLEDRLILHKCSQDKIGLTPDVTADFILAFYMVHETLNPVGFFQEVKTLLKKGGKFLVVEPLVHVNNARFLSMRMGIEETGFSVVESSSGLGGRRLLLTV